MQISRNISWYAFKLFSTFDDNGVENQPGFFPHPLNCGRTGITIARSRVFTSVLVAIKEL